MLLISPLITNFLGKHDSAIYLTVLYVFVSLLLLGVRRTGSRWTSWYQKMVVIDDKTLREWYIQRESAENANTVEEKTEPALLKASRQSLHGEILKAKSGFFYSKGSDDPLVSKLAKCYDSTIFLMVSPKPLCLRFRPTEIELV